MKRLINQTLIISGLALFCFSASSRQDTQIRFLTQQASTPSFSSFMLTNSRPSIITFLEKAFNHPRYSQDFLALNFTHVLEALALSEDHSHPRNFIQKAVNLFSLKLHGIFVNPYALCTFIENLIVQVGSHFDQETEDAATIELFKQTIGTFLSREFDRLRVEPDATLHRLSSELYELTQPTEEKDCSITKLQSTVHYFLSRAMGLVTWSPDDQEDAWHIMVALSNAIAHCVEHNLIDYDMADDLYWDLLHQFSEFLSLAGHELSPNFFQLAHTELQQVENAFWHTPERELYITTKQQYLKEVLMKAEVTAQMHAAGYHT